MDNEAEEVRNASEVTPKTMFWSYMLNIPLAFAMLLVFLFAMTDVATATTEAFPFVWILQNSLSTAGAQAITAIMFILVFMIDTSCFASTSRQLFAFARDDGMPFSTWMKKVNPRLNVAANACYVTLGYTVVMSLIYLGSPIAFNAIISLAIVALMATYAISIACVLWRRITLPETLPPVFWSLRKWGVVVNGIGLTYAIFSFFWAFWPIYWEPTAEEVRNSPCRLLMAMEPADVRSTDEFCDRHLCRRYVAFCCQLLCQRASQVYGSCGDMRRAAGGLNAHHELLRLKSSLRPCSFRVGKVRSKVCLVGAF